MKRQKELAMNIAIWQQETDKIRRNNEINDEAKKEAIELLKNDIQKMNIELDSMK